jgi:hypothetical protein
MALRFAIELGLAAAALALLARDLLKAWRDKQRRPATLLVATAVAVLLAGMLGGRSRPDGGWLALPAAVLVWEAARGWRRTPRSHLWEAGMAAFAAALVCAALGFVAASGALGTGLLVAAALAGAAGFGLLWESRRREPKPWRADDVARYERRARARAGDEERRS